MFTADKIDDCGVWLGDITASEDHRALDEHNISHIITLLDYQPKHLDPKRTYLIIHAEDFHSTDLLTNEFDKCFQFIEQSIVQGQQILIHCHAGVSRSATIAAMYLMRKYSLTRDEALERLRSKRRFWSVLPNDGFLRQLDLFYQMNYKIDLENELYKEFQRQRFAPIKSEAATPTVLFSTDDSEREYKCRQCHEKLFHSSDIQKHDLSCLNSSQIFTFFLDWIDDIFVNSVGAIRCPNCQINLGEYSLQGLRCVCHQWIKPAFVFQHQLIE
ncbi:unnamed protein product [Adineta ricciae]|uniref:protein-tyrosine-phosphatase n=1 Tax=Adineta ricciae TaxID=249248 RepID=A0A815NZP9_ADIRI|nr:unnamed protein product [Adineta ricciae]CAF1438046.1 unnamed protein product [Adineta ricciae]